MNEKEEAIFDIRIECYLSFDLCACALCAVHCEMHVLSCVSIYTMCVLDTFRHFDCKSPPVVKTIIITKHAYLHG